MILFIAFELNVCVNGVTTNKRDEVSDVHRLYFFHLLPLLMHALYRILYTWINSAKVKTDQGNQEKKEAESTE